MRLAQLNMFKPQPQQNLTDRSFVGPFCLHYPLLSVPCSLVFSSGKRPLLCVMFLCVFVSILYGVSGQVWYLIILSPDTFRVSLHQPSVKA